MAKLFVEAAGISTEDSRWSPQRIGRQSSGADEAGRQWYVETMRRIFPQAIIDDEGTVPPFVVERSRVPEGASLRQTLRSSREARPHRTPIEIFNDFAEKVPVGGAVKFATCLVQRPSQKEIVVTYLDTKVSKTLVREENADRDDRTVQVVKVTRQDGMMEIRETWVRFKDGVERATKTSSMRDFDPEFAPLTANMWHEYLRRTVQIRGSTFQIGKEIHVFQRQTDFLKVSEVNFWNLARKLAYLQRVREIAPQTVIQQHLPVLMNYIDMFDGE